MAIPDPYAIPEDAQTCEEYLHEGDAAWDAGNNDQAYDLYYSLRQSQFAPAAAYDHATYRLGLIAQTRGDTDLAVQFFTSSQAPGSAEALHALTNVTTNDPTPDPDVIPSTAEQLLAYIDDGYKAGQGGDWQRCLGIYLAATQSPVAAPTQIGMSYYQCGVASEYLGDQEGAMRYYEQALPMMPDDENAAHARNRIAQLGGAQVAATGTTPSETQVAAGIQAYENGDAHAAHEALQAALHLEGPDDQKARARYYLAAMDYQNGHYADARNHVEAAVGNAPEPEKSWAEAMLHWRWEEEPQASATSYQPTQP
jgi:tetratricopeptide (TPR) repeat protein